MCACFFTLVERTSHYDSLYQGGSPCMKMFCITLFEITLKKMDVDQY